jgi:hypothetical protein
MIGFQVKLDRPTLNWSIGVGPRQPNIITAKEVKTGPEIVLNSSI